MVKIGQHMVKLNLLLKWVIKCICKSISACVSIGIVSRRSAVMKDVLALFRSVVSCTVNTEIEHICSPFLKALQNRG